MDHVRRLKIDGKKFSRRHLHIDAHDEMESGLTLDAVVRQRVPILELPAREEQALLVRGDALPVLDPRCFFFAGWIVFRRDFASRLRSD